MLWQGCKKFIYFSFIFTFIIEQAPSNCTTYQSVHLHFYAILFSSVVLVTVQLYSEDHI